MCIRDSLGDSATIDIDAYYNRKFKGIVTQIASSNNGAANQVSVNTGTDVTNYKVYIRLLPESYQDLLDPTRPKSFPFRPGMSASADIKTKTHENRLSVPLNAVTTRDKNDTLPGDKKIADNPKSSNDMSDQNETSASTDDLEEVVFTVQNNHKVKKVKVRTDIQDIN